MKKRILGHAAMLLALGVLADGHAGTLRLVEDGCDRLRDVIVSQVGALLPDDRQPALRREAKGEPVVADPPQYCMDTAAATTAAFGAAMYAAGMPVHWGPAGTESGRFCSSRSLSQCYPRLAYSEMATAQQLDFVQSTWKAVSTGITGAMPYGVASDMTVFDRNALERSISSDLYAHHQSIISPISANPQE